MTNAIMTDAQRIAMLEATIATMKVASQRKLTLKVSEKGAVSMYGTGRFPVTLYADTWKRVLAEADHVLAFIETNKALLSFKP